LEKTVGADGKARKQPTKAKVKRLGTLRQPLADYAATEDEEADTYQADEKSPEEVFADSGLSIDPNDNASRAVRDRFFQCVDHGPNSAARAIIGVLGRDRAREVMNQLAAELSSNRRTPWPTPIAHDAKGPGGRAVRGFGEDLVMAARNMCHPTTARNDEEHALAESAQRQTAEARERARARGRPVNDAA